MKILLVSFLVFLPTLVWGQEGGEEGPIEEPVGTAESAETIEESDITGETSKSTGMSEDSGSPPSEPSETFFIPGGILSRPRATDEGEGRRPAGSSDPLNIYLEYIGMVGAQADRNVYESSLQAVWVGKLFVLGGRADFTYGTGGYGSAEAGLDSVWISPVLGLNHLWREQCLTYLTAGPSFVDGLSYFAEAGVRGWSHNGDVQARATFNYSGLGQQVLWLDVAVAPYDKYRLFLDFGYRLIHVPDLTRHLGNMGLGYEWRPSKNIIHLRWDLLLDLRLRQFDNYAPESRFAYTKRYWGSLFNVEFGF